MAEKIRFSTSLYRRDAIDAAVNAYQQLASFSVGSENGGEVIVVIDKIHPNFASMLIDSFCNHVLFETIVRYRQEQEGSSA